METYRFLLASFALTAGCASQAGPDYEGESLLHVEGNIVNQGSVAPANVAVVLDWVTNAAASPPLVWGTEAKVQGDFPAAFTLDLFTPPPTDLVFDWLGSTTPIGHAGIYVVQVDDHDEPVATLGKSPDHEILYVPSDVPADSPIGAFYGPLTAGYHVMIDSWQPSAEDLAQCIATLESSGCAATTAQQQCAMTGPQVSREANSDDKVAIVLGGAPPC